MTFLYCFQAQSDWIQDTNREVVLQHLSKILDSLMVEDLRKTSLGVLYNLGQDFGKNKPC